MTDDADFMMIPGFQVYTANFNGLARANAQDTLRAR
jgi:hypothetical protein